jgi:lysozyme
VKTNAGGVELIVRNEGEVLHAYQPVPWEPHWTIGVGHYGADVRAGETITQAQSRAMLRRDLARFEAAVTAAMRGVKGLTPNRFAGLVSLAYNCGPGAVTGSIRTYALAGNWDGVYSVMRQYVRAGGHVLPGLVRRRNEEIALMRRGAAAARPRDPFAGYPALERRWCQEYDRLKARNQNVARRRELRALMLARRKDIWRAAQRTGHGNVTAGMRVRHREQRYHSLLSRTTSRAA